MQEPVAAEAPIRPIARLLAGLAGLVAAACAAEPPHDAFTATGELVALSGGDAGARRACVICHGLAGEGDGQLSPRLAGLPEGYLLKQLQDYADGRRSHPEMGAIARALDPRARREVSAYYARQVWRPLPGEASDGMAAALYHRGDRGRGLPACSTCHGAAGEGLGAANPPLAGQPSGYLAKQVADWRASRRRNDPQDAMLQISRRLTPAEGVALARYSAALPGGSATPAGAGSAGPGASP